MAFKKFWREAFTTDPLKLMLEPEEWDAMERAALLANAERHQDAEAVREEAGYHGL